MKKILILILLISTTSSCVTRLKTPLIEGNVYNSNKEPLKEVEVCLNNECINTDENGYFYFKRKTKKEFTMVGSETTAVIYNLSISKVEYKDTILYYKNIHGGANIDLKVKYDSIILKKE